MIIISMIIVLIKVRNSDAIEKCLTDIVESKPEGLVLPDPVIPTTPTATALLDIINGAQKSLKIASFYWSMTASEPSGKFIFDMH